MESIIIWMKSIHIQKFFVSTLTHAHIQRKCVVCIQLLILNTKIWQKQKSILNTEISNREIRTNGIEENAKYERKKQWNWNVNRFPF